MKIYIHTNGCAVLKHETERIATFFHLNNMEIADLPEEGDIVVVTCCGVTHNEENQAIEIISELFHRKREDAMFIVSGCLPAFASDRILQVAPDATLMTYAQMSDLDNIIHAKTKWDDVYYNHGHMMKQEEHRDDTIKTADTDCDFQLARTVDATNKTNNCVRQYELCSCPLKSLIRRDVPNPKRLGKLFNHVQKEPHGPFEVVCSCR